MQAGHLHFYFRSKKFIAIVFCHTLLLIFLTFVSAQAQPLTITSFSPVTVCQGNAVTITGTNFTGATNVKLGNINASSFIVNSATTITAYVDNQATTGSVTVTTPDSTVTGPGTLTVMPSPIPLLLDVSALDAPFTNCDGNATYQVIVHNSSTVAGTNNAYQITWGDNSAPFTQTDWPAGAELSHTYNAQGYFNIVLTITPSNGCKKSVTYQFYNGNNPLASLTTSTSTTGLCVPASIEFQIGNWFGNSAGTKYVLDFGDGSPDVTLQHPLNGTNTVQLISHQYTTSSCPSQDFTATLHAINGCFTTTYTLNQIIIRKKPAADFSIPVISPCSNGPVCFTNMTTNGYSGNGCNTNTAYLWDFGDGSPTSAEISPCHIYQTPGPYNVTLTASNTACGSDIIIKALTVLPPSPQPVVSATPVIYCQGQPAVPLTATGTGLLWYTTSTGGTGSTIAPTPDTNSSGSIIYYVSQSLANSCESPRVPVTVTINAAPAAPAVTTPVQLCQNQTTTPLTANGPGLLWYTSATGGAGSPTAPTPSTAAIGNATFYVSQTTGTCEGPRSSILVVVNSLAAAPVVTSPVTYCQNQNASPLTATGSGLLWYSVATGGTGSATAPIPSTNMAGSTVYYVSQVTGCGEGPRTSITVNVNASPSASINYNVTNLCNVINSASTPNPPIAVTLTGTAGGSYSITPPGGLSVDPITGTITPSGATAGTYTIKYLIPGTDGCSDFIATAIVDVSGSPNAIISYPPICTSDAITPVQLTGKQGGVFASAAGLIIDASKGAITPGSSTPGIYTVTYSIAASPPCPGFETTTGVTITKALAAGISYGTVNLCNVLNTATTPNPPIAATLTGNTGGSYSISPATGLPIDPTTGTIDPSGSTPGAYTIAYTIPGAGGCANYSATSMVTVSGTPMATVSYPGSPYCQGINTPQQVLSSGTTGGTFSSTQGLFINAATGEINPSLSTPGIYTITYTIAASAPCPGFTTTTNAEIKETPVITFPTPVQSICSGGVAVFTPSSTVTNTTYAWSVVGVLPSNVSGISSGTTSGPLPDISLSFINTGATSESIIVQVIPANSSQNPCSGTPYNLTLVVNPIAAAPLADTADFCMGMPASALAISQQPGNIVKWYDENFILIPAAPVISTAVPASFVYYASETNTYGCESPKSKILAVVHPTAKIISSDYTNPTTCGIASGSIILNVLDLNNNPIPGIPLVVHYDKFQTAYEILDSTDASGKITVPLVAGTYSGIYVETSGCVSQKIPDIFILKDPTPPEQPVAGYNPPLCSETPLNLTAISPTGTQAGPIDYVWVGPAFGPFADTVRNTVISFPSAPVSDAGTYIVYAIQNNCISPATNFQVIIKQSPTKPLIYTRTPLCVGDDLILQANSSMPGDNPVLDFLWAGPGAGFPVHTSNAAINNVKIQDAGIYSITASSPQTGCSSTSDTLIKIGGFPVVKFAQDSLTLPTGFLLNLAPAITNAAEPGILPMLSYEWTPSQDLNCNDAICSSPVATIKNNICYTVKATNVYGCSGSDVICIKVFCKGSQIFVPNAFTPRGDVPENAKFMVRASGISAVKSFRVFNRWGRLLFERNNFPPNNPDFGWDGRVNGKIADAGVYIYTTEVICENGVPYFFKGNLTLL